MAISQKFGATALGKFAKSPSLDECFNNWNAKCRMLWLEGNKTKFPTLFFVAIIATNCLPSVGCDTYAHQYYVNAWISMFWVREWMIIYTEKLLEIVLHITTRLPSFLLWSIVVNWKMVHLPCNDVIVHFDDTVWVASSKAETHKKEKDFTDG
jgi:hypothetical protein